MVATSCKTCEPAVDRDKIAALVKNASSSFYWAMRILQKPKREAIFAVYAFCRAVDDVADGPIELSVKETALRRWANEIDALYDGKPQFSIVQALAKPVRDFDLKREDFHAVIDGMLMDAQGPVVAPDTKTLDIYCDRVASAVGRLCVCIFGEPGPAGQNVAYHQGRALQMTNILRDVGEDAREGRLYLPAETLAKFGLQGVAPEKVMQHAGFAAMWRELAEQTEQRYRETYAALARCERRNMRASYIMADIYHLNLKRMMALSDEQITDPAFNKRLVGKFEKLAIALKAFRG